MVAAGVGTGAAGAVAAAAGALACRWWWWRRWCLAAGVPAAPLAAGLAAAAAAGGRGRGRGRRAGGAGTRRGMGRAGQDRGHHARRDHARDTHRGGHRPQVPLAPPPLEHGGAHVCPAVVHEVLAVTVSGSRRAIRRPSGRYPPYRPGGPGKPRFESQSRAWGPRMIAAVLAVLASTHDGGGHGHGAPVHRGGQAGARVQDVVQHIAAAPPAPGGGAGRGQPALPDGHHRGRARAAGPPAGR